MTGYRELREAVLAGNLALPAHGLVVLTTGNASQIDREQGVLGIKPSGVSYDAMTAEDIVILDLEGAVVAGDRAPSSDTPTHLELYRRFDEIGGIVHTHSTWATVWAQAQRDIPLYGTTHADLSAEPIPVTRALTEAEIQERYEAATGQALVEAIAGLGPAQIPAALARGHAPFIWGPTLAKAVENAIRLEEVAQLAFLTATLVPSAAPLDAAVRDKHRERRHGMSAYPPQR
jgi:L-ribulose-5-phosphate 4-epimerase